MINLKYFILCLLSHVCYTAGWTQQSFRKCYGFDCRDKKWEFSIFAGYAVPNRGNGFVNEMEGTTPDQPVPGPQQILRCFPKTHFAETSTQLPWNAEARYLLPRRKAISLAIGKLNGQSFSVFAEDMNEPLFQVRSEVYSASLNYIFSFRGKRDNINIGPVVAWHHMYSNQSVNEIPESSSLKAGVNVGYTFNVIKTEKWSLGFKANYTWLHNTEMGPYTIEHELNEFEGNSDACTSTLSRNKIQLQTLQFGLITGWRF